MWTKHLRSRVLHIFASCVHSVCPACWRTNIERWRKRWGTRAQVPGHCSIWLLPHTLQIQQKNMNYPQKLTKRKRNAQEKQLSVHFVQQFSFRQICNIYISITGCIVYVVFFNWFGWLMLICSFISLSMIFWPRKPKLYFNNCFVVFVLQFWKKKSTKANKISE